MPAELACLIPPPPWGEVVVAAEIESQSCSSLLSADPLAESPPLSHTLLLSLLLLLLLLLLLFLSGGEADTEAGPESESCGAGAGEGLLGAIAIERALALSLELMRRA